MGRYFEELRASNNLQLNVHEILVRRIFRGGNRTVITLRMPCQFEHFSFCTFISYR